MLLATAAALPMAAAVNPPAGAVEPVTSTADTPQWYALMSSHLSASDRQNRYIYYDGSRLATAQYPQGLDGLSDVTDYAWRLEDVGDGTVRLVHYDGLEVFVPAGAEDAANTQLLMQADGSAWQLMTSASTGQSDCAELQYVLDWAGRSGEHAYLNAMDGSVTGNEYGVTIYSAGAHQASGWFFVPLEIEGGTEPGPDPDPDPDPDPEPPTSDSGYIVADPFETMVRLGRMSPSSPLYTMPAGPGGNVYLTSAMTTGDAVDYPLGYTASTSPSKYFVVVSRQTSLIMRDALLQLVMTTNADPSNLGVTVWTDWNRDGNYDRSDGETTVDAAAKSITHSLNVPADAALGKTRIRVRLDSQSAGNADAAATGGKVYDFVVYVLEGEERDDCHISVSSSDTRWGTAYVETTPNADGRYDKGTDVTVVAVINEDADKEVTFKGWTLGGDTVSKELTYTFTVSESVHLTAVFSVPGPVAPVASTEDDPVWYQIMNAHTAAERAERYIAYDTDLDATYTTALRAEKPADTTSKFLWRLEEATGGMVRIINRASGLAITGDGTLAEEMQCTATGSQFLIAQSGAENESWSIMYEGIDNRLLNAQDGTWAIVLYDAGIGTGSGWYFTEVKINEDPGSGITGAHDAAAPTAQLADGMLSLRGLPSPCTVRAYNLSGQLLVSAEVCSTDASVRTGRTETFVLAVITPNDGGEATVIKCIDVTE